MASSVKSLKLLAYKLVSFPDRVILFVAVMDATVPYQDEGRIMLVVAGPSLFLAFVDADVHGHTHQYAPYRSNTCYGYVHVPYTPVSPRAILTAGMALSGAGSAHQHG